MDSLPDEILADILDYLESTDLVSAQRISPRLLKLARDNSLWRYKCFERSPSAAASAAHSNALAALTGALGGLSLSDAHPSTHNHTHSHPFSSASATESRSRISKRAQAAADWDRSNASGKIDWYSEFIARHAPLSTHWSDDDTPQSLEIRGIAAFSDATKAVGALEDGSLCIWEVVESINGRKRFRELGRTASCALFEDATVCEGPSDKRGKISFSGVTECVNLDSARKKAFVAVDRYLNEVDLSTLQVVSQQTYAWPITALSQEKSFDTPITVGTMWSLNLYDPRVPMRDRSRSPEDMLRSYPADPESSIAFLPNYMKNAVVNPGTVQPQYSPPTMPPLLLSHSQPFSLSPLQHSRCRNRRRYMSDYARIEPGPLSILHHGEHDVLIAGRFPSILSYDRRYFPRLQHVLHSGARLSSLTSLPYPPPHIAENSGAKATLIACGEYGGRGSLELYSLPHLKQEINRNNYDYGLTNTACDLGAADREHAMSRAFSEPEYPFSYKNRQEASSSKLLSVAVQGTRIVFSDAEGGLKWVERDGRGLARKWNINSFKTNSNGASLQGEQVVRKIVPLATPQSGRGVRGDGDLLVWTGERMGIVTTKPKRDEDELTEAFATKLSLDDEGETAEIYARTMRQALERQADELNWMGRFGLR